MRSRNKLTCMERVQHYVLLSECYMYIVKVIIIITGKSIVTSLIRKNKFLSRFPFYIKTMAT